MNLCNLKTSSAIAGLLMLLSSRPGHSEPKVPLVLEPTDDACTRDEQCDRHYRSAQKLSRAGRLEEALAEYQLAHELQPVATLLYNIARLHHKLNRVSESIAGYQSYLRLESGTLPELRRKAGEYLAALQAASPPRLGPPQVASPAALDSKRTSSVISSATSQGFAANRPVHMRWWFWSLLGSAVVTGAVVGAVLGTWPRTPESAERLSLSFP